MNEDMGFRKAGQKGKPRKWGNLMDSIHAGGDMKEEIIKGILRDVFYGFVEDAGLADERCDEIIDIAAERILLLFEKRNIEWAQQAVDWAGLDPVKWGDLDWSGLETKTHTEPLVGKKIKDTVICDEHPEADFETLDRVKPIFACPEELKRAYKAIREAREALLELERRL